MESIDGEWALGKVVAAKAVGVVDSEAILY